MNADKIDAKKETIFLDKASSFALNILFFQIHRRSLHHVPSNDLFKI
jgi:hypothetical protein